VRAKTGAAKAAPVDVPGQVSGPARTRPTGGATPPTVQPLTARFGTEGLFELTYLIAWENVRARMNSALGIPVGGFSQGKVCALPAPRENRAIV
jgi:hypothetical protein